MGFRLTMARVHVPASIRKGRLETLFAATADAFGVPVPPTRHLTADECLKSYAEFTRHHAGKALQSRDTSETQARLFQNARRLGEQLRGEFTVTSAQDVMRLARLVYKLIRIDFRGEPGGDITITRCFFSSYYSGLVCRLVSSLDAGLLAGLSGGGRLVFTERITEGSGCCRAYLDMSKEPS